MTREAMDFVVSLWEVRQRHSLGEARRRRFTLTQEAIALTTFPRWIIAKAATEAMAGSGGHLLLSDWLVAAQSEAASEQQREQARLEEHAARRAADEAREIERQEMIADAARRARLKVEEREREQSVWTPKPPPRTPARMEDAERVAEAAAVAERRWARQQAIERGDLTPRAPSGFTDEVPVKCPNCERLIDPEGHCRC
jgi:hypothetical protein